MNKSLYRKKATYFFLAAILALLVIILAPLFDKIPSKILPISLGFFLELFTGGFQLTALLLGWPILIITFIVSIFYTVRSIFAPDTVILPTSSMINDAPKAMADTKIETTPRSSIYKVLSIISFSIGLIVLLFAIKFTIIPIAYVMFCASLKIFCGYLSGEGAEILVQIFLIPLEVVIGSIVCSLGTFFWIKHKKNLQTSKV